MRWVLKFGSYKKTDDIFDAVLAGVKTIETRPINQEKKRNYSQIQVGDELTLVSLDSGRKIDKTVHFVRIYSSIAEMADAEEVEKIVPGVKTAADLVQIFEELKKKWGSEYARKLDKYGVIAIGMK